MKKVSYLILAFYLTTVASLSAETLNLYGLAHASIDRNDDGVDSSFYIASSSSRLGVKGGYNIDHTSAVFIQLESGIDFTGRGENDGNGGSQSNSLFTRARDSFVGYKGRWGNIKMGRLGVLNQWVYDFDLFADQVGDLGNLWGSTGIPGRADQAIAVELGYFDNVVAMIEFVPENGKQNQDIFLAKLSLKADSFNINFAAANIGQGNSVTAQQVFAIIGAYQLDKTQIGFGWQRESEISGIKDNYRSTFTLGASYPVGSGKVKFQYTSSSSELRFYDGSQIAVGYDQILNSQVTTYVAFSSTNNDELASFTTNNYGHGSSVIPVAGNDPLSISFGMIYQFNVGVIE
jgi:predicted porin